MELFQVLYKKGERVSWYRQDVAIFCFEKLAFHSISPGECVLFKLSRFVKFHSWMIRGLASGESPELLPK